MHSSLVGSIFEMSLTIPKTIFKKKFPQGLLGEIGKLNFDGKFADFFHESLWKFFIENWLRYCQGHFKNGPHQRTMQTHPCPDYKGENQGRNIFKLAVAPRKIIFLQNFISMTPLHQGGIMGVEWGKLVDIMTHFRARTKIK